MTKIKKKRKTSAAKSARVHEGNYELKGFPHQRFKAYDVKSFHGAVAIIKHFRGPGVHPKPRASNWSVSKILMSLYLRADDINMVGFL